VDLEECGRTGETALVVVFDTVEIGDCAVSGQACRSLQKQHQEVLILRPCRNLERLCAKTLSASAQSSQIEKNICENC